MLTGKEHKLQTQELWALDDVSFSVQEGEVLGVIGRNGAGKSTLLKVLTRITTPTSGRVEIRGRVGSLLEVGTGFHPELTGRENIYLNGAILGMKRREIQQKLPDMVEFSGVERFLDTPVKRYSSGMYVRLAFSVAAHLEPEILLVDEVLAVGDAEFQARCLGRMEDLGATGRTVLFVSHNMQAVAQLCDRVILMEHGAVVRDGPGARRRRALPPDLRRRRLDPHVGRPRERTRRRPREAPCGEDRRPRRRDGRLRRRAATPSGSSSRSACFATGLRSCPKIKLVADGRIAFNAMDVDPRWNEPSAPGEYVATAWIPGNLLNEGLVSIDAAVCSIGSPKLRHHVSVHEAVSFHVQDPVEGDSARGSFTGQWRGVVRPLLDWSAERVG